MPTRKRRIRQAEIVRLFAERLRGLRQAQGLTQRELARQAHVTASYISTLEAGGAAPGIDLLERLAVALHASVIELLPAPVPPEAEGYRVQVKELFEAALVKAGPETISMLKLFLERIATSPAIHR